jgi:hypothetical protein
MVRQPGTAVAPDLLWATVTTAAKLIPKALDAAATNAKAPTDFACAFPFFARLHDPLAQVF